MDLLKTIFLSISRNKSYVGRISLFLAAMIWGTSFAIVKDNMSSTSPFFLVTVRFSIGALLVGYIFRKKFVLINRQYIIYGIAVGVILFAAGGFQMYGLKYTTPGKNAFLLTCYSIMVPMITWAVEHKRPKWMHFLSAGICVAGIGFISLTENFTIGWGDGLTLISSFFYGIQICLLAKVCKELDPILLVVIQFISGAVCNWIACFVTGTMPQISGFTTGVILQILYLSVFGTSIGVLLQNIGQKYTESSQASIILSLEAVFATLFSVLFFHEQLTLRLFIGFVLILAAVLLSQREEKST